MLDIIGGLDAAHAAGILHRDIKPSNCFVDRDGRVKVGDFGLSISTLARDVRQRARRRRAFEGTPQFAAPEQLRGEPLDVRADIYAVGATLYYLLTGQPPFDARDLRELVANVTTEPPVVAARASSRHSARPRRRRPAMPREGSRRTAAVVYGELADLLRPYAAARDLAAPLGTRLVA